MSERGLKHSSELEKRTDIGEDGEDMMAGFDGKLEGTLSGRWRWQQEGRVVAAAGASGGGNTPQTSKMAYEPGFSQL
jgi:hypothetical protein